MISVHKRDLGLGEREKEERKPEIPRVLRHEPFLVAEGEREEDPKPQVLRNIKPALRT